ncbi:DUF6318 family protein [Sinomonas terrae]|uniref:DUF6318 family protein n=1 Tax=Sinomonas terrae TaxID=2908838 RepID=UPI003557F40D
MAPRRPFCCSLLLICLLLLTGCGTSADADPASASTAASASADASAPPPTPDPRPTPASSRGPARNVPPPALPEAAKQNTAEGFEAFTQYWLDSVTYAFGSGDIEPLKLASSSSCQVCGRFIDQVRQLHDEGGWAAGPSWTVRSFTTDMTRDPSRQFLGRYLGIESTSVDYSSDGSIRRSFPGDPSGMSAAMRFSPLAAR